MSGFVYLYCLLPGEDAVDVAGIDGMEAGQPVRLLSAGRLQAAWSEVGDDFAEGNLNARIRDLDWLSPRAVRHHAAVDALYGRCKPLLPLSFGAIFRSVESLERRLSAQQEELRARLDRLRGRNEWNLKLTREQAVFARELLKLSPELQILKTDLAVKAPGTRFLLEKKLLNMEAREAQRISAGVRSEVHQRLAAHAVKAQRDQLSAPAPEEPVRLELRSAYLVEDQAVDGLKSALDGLAAKYAPLGYSFQLTGPWPAFTFARGVQEALA